jgi:small subunit ribosomal protein S3
VALSVTVEELKRSEVAATYVAQEIAWDLERRMPFRRTMKKYLEQIMQNRDVKGARVFLSGRLDGNEIARRERLSRGSLPLQTLRADIDYGTATAKTTYGTIGVKIWIYKGEIFEKKEKTKE